MKRRFIAMVIAFGLLFSFTLASIGPKVNAKAATRALPGQLMTDSVPFFGCETPSFAAASNFAAGRNPESVTTGDFNRDGKLDLAVANDGSADVSILLGNGSGGFAAPTNFSVDNPLAITTGDFNGDGKLDIAVTSINNLGNVYLLTGNGSGGFTVTGPFDVGQAPQGITAGDFNGDGKLDLATANANNGNVSVLIGNGNGGFATATTFATDNQPRSITTGDFNADGKLDLAVANFGAHNVSILLGKGNGSFETATNFDVQQVPTSIATGDFNSDGKLDLVTSHASLASSHNLTLLLGNGNGGFGTPNDFGANSGASSITTGDFNSDGKLDVALSHSSSDNVSILLGNGTSGFGTETTFATDDSPEYVATGDFNRDGKLDLVTANQRPRQDGNVSILINNCMAAACSIDFKPAPSSPESVGNIPYSVAISDFNHDGKLDIATLNEFSENVTILLGDGAGDFSPVAATPGTGKFPQSMVLGDFNLDGKSDLAVANSHSMNVTILLGDGTGHFSQPTTSPETVGDTPEWIVEGDFNLDGKPDLAVANLFSDNVTILLGDGTGNFTQPASSPQTVPSSPYGLAVGDFNLDGKPDLATADFHSDSVTILLGDGKGNFSKPASSPEAVGAFPRSVAVGDFNLDGKPDIAAANSGSGAVTILLGDGTGNFTAAAISPAVTETPETVTVGDFNNDGRPDLATTDNLSDKVTILLGDGNGGFSQPGSSPEAGGDSPRLVAMGDFNRDGRPDLAVADAFANQVKILLGDCNIAPTIAAQSVSQIADTTSNNVMIATVSDPDQTQQSLVVTISSNGTTFSSSASINGVSISSLAVDSTGKVTASIAASCTASTAGFTLKVTDNASAISAVTFTVTVTAENKAPQITCANIVAQTAPTNASCQAAVPDVSALVRAQSADNCTAQGSLTITQNPTAGSNVSGTGSHPITVTVTDAAGNHTDCVVPFSLTDNTPPSITAPANIVKGTDPNQCSAVVTFANPTVSDNCSGVGTPTCTPPSGSVFAKGVSSVTCNVSDAAGNHASCSFSITVNDTQPPFIATLANITVPAEPGFCAAFVSYRPPAVSDNCPGVGAPTCTPLPSVFPKRTTVITCSVRDAATNLSTTSFTVTVVDTQAPEIADSPNIVINTVNAGDASVAVNFPTPWALDNCSGVGVVCVPPSGSQFPKGVTAVTCTATDASGNQSSSSFTVKVFDYVIADDLNGKILRFVSTTGDYDFFDCRKNQSASGRGVVTINFCKTELVDTSAGRNLAAQANPCTKRGSASLIVGGVTHTLSDSNLSSNPVKCP